MQIMGDGVLTSIGVNCTGNGLFFHDLNTVRLNTIATPSICTRGDLGHEIS